MEYKPGETTFSTRYANTDEKTKVQIKNVFLILLTCLIGGVYWLVNLSQSPENTTVSSPEQILYKTESYLKNRAIEITVSSLEDPGNANFLPEFTNVTQTSDTTWHVSGKVYDKNQHGMIIRKIYHVNFTARPGCFDYSKERCWTGVSKPILTKE